MLRCYARAVLVVAFDNHDACHASNADWNMQYYRLANSIYFQQWWHMPKSHRPNTMMMRYPKCDRINNEILAICVKIYLMFNALQNTLIQIRCNIVHHNAIWHMTSYVIPCTSIQCIASYDRVQYTIYWNIAINTRVRCNRPLKDTLCHIVQGRCQDNNVLHNTQSSYGTLACYIVQHNIQHDIAVDTTQLSHVLQHHTKSYNTVHDPVHDTNHCAIT